MDTLTTNELESKVLQASEPVALDFYQASCAPCRTLEPRLERLAEAYKGHVRVFRVDLEQDMSIAKRFGVMSIPTVIFFRSGQELERLDGLITDEQLRAAFDRASAGAAQGEARSS